MVVRKDCDDCKEPIFMLRTIAGAWWPFNSTPVDAPLVPDRHSWGIKKVNGQLLAALLDGAIAPGGKVLTRHFCAAYRQRYQDIEGAANVLRPIGTLQSAATGQP